MSTAILKKNHKKNAGNPGKTQRKKQELSRALRDNLIRRKKDARKESTA